MDKLTPEQRKLCMQKNKNKNTKPEIIVRSICHSLGLRFRLHRNDLPGHPDLTFPKYRTCIFVHGCFWHQHPSCKLSSSPKTRVEYWTPKLAKNVERDANNIASLQTLGWRAIVIWECETKEISLLKRKILTLFTMNTDSESSATDEHRPPI
ncbi:TPA: very short patch repair endonuclease [Pseudomonas aeruginosa]|uniref:very short patch repair endonuclease n=1 Tax=Pseudomonas aeruginosa TaxID=287 RepID=UPI003006EC24